VKVLFIFGTRPEAIKMAPIVKLFQKESDMCTKVCVTAQHRQMLDSVLAFFEIVPDFDLDLMKNNQTLSSLSAGILGAMVGVYEKYLPDVVFVQGDTTTAFIGALSAFYKKIKICHIEAGLRSFDKYSPFPEEANRSLIARIADFHFVPTVQCVENLKMENVSTNIFNVGNSAIDALFYALAKTRNNGDSFKDYFNFLDLDKKIVLITGHRRESFGEGFENICLAIKELANRYSDMQFVYPIHPNPNVLEPVKQMLFNQHNVYLIEPLDYPYLVWLLDRSFFVLTDSGGIQEEAPALGKPVLVMRDVTERTEGVQAGTAKLVGTSRKIIVEQASMLFDNEEAYIKMANAVNPYGDGTTSKQILEVVRANC
jgi:UDP-N-acetylglucosamine 2-epimerase (non-hydrolysing)